MATYLSNASCLRAAHVLLRDHFHVQPRENLLITADDGSDPGVVRALADTAAMLGARPCVMNFPRLPFQGSLSDPFIPETVTAAARTSDVWLDLSFPYMAGSSAFDAAMEAKRSRYLLLGDVTAAGFGRLYGSVNFDALFELQLAADKLFAEAEGSVCRITADNGTDLSFVMGRPTTKKLRHATQPGAQTVPGSAIFYPELDSVRGTVVLDAVFHEYYTPLTTPLTLEVDGKVRSVTGGSGAKVMDRALRRAGGGEYGNVIHLTLGLHPGAANTGRSFIEDIRAVGCNAIGLGLPWWLPGGGENHPDGVVANQSLWIGDLQIVDRGMPVGNHPIAALLNALAPST